MINALKVMFGLDEALAVYLGLLEIYTSSKYDVRLEYIEASGTQYIDTEIIPNNTTLSVETCLAITDSSQNSSILASVDDNLNTLRYYPLCYHNGIYSCNFNGSWNNDYRTIITGLSTDTFYTIYSSIGNGSTTLECDNDSKTISRQDGPISKSLYLFARNGSEVTTFASCKIKYMKIYLDGRLISCLVPVKKNNEVCMYDTVRRKLFKNKGTGNFIAGPEMSYVSPNLPEGYTELKCISSTKTGGQYINLGYKLMETTDDIQIDIKYNIKGHGKTNALLSTLLLCMKEVDPWPGFVMRIYNETITDYSRIEFQTKWLTTNSWETSSNKSWYQNYASDALSTCNRRCFNVYEDTIYLDNISLDKLHDGDTTLFCALNSNNNPFRFVRADLYYLRIKKGGVIIRDLIPAKKVDHTELVGLYDMYNDMFYPSQGANQFVGEPYGDNYDAELEYLETTTSNSFIKTDIVPNANTGIYIKAMHDSSISSDQYVIGTRNDSNSTRWCIGHSSTGWYYGLGSATKFNSGVIYSDIVAEVTLNFLNSGKSTLKVENDLFELTIGSLSFNPSSFAKIRLFGAGGTTSLNYMKWLGRIYAAKISQGNEIIMDFIPVRKNGIGYMYDKISLKLFMDDGYDPFVLGPDKLPNEYTKLEYVESTGTQYIDTGFKPNTKSVIVDTEVAIADMTQDGIILGAIDNENDIRYYLIGFNNEHFYVKNDSGSSDLSLLSPVSITLNEFNTIHSKLASSALISVSNTVSSSMASVAKFNDSKSLYLFANNSSSPSNFIKCKIKYLKIYEDDVLIRDFVPCKNSNDIVGLYDRINNIFYSSQTSLVAGPEI